MYAIISLLIVVGLSWAVITSDSKEHPRETKTYYSNLNNTGYKAAKKVYKGAKKKYYTYKFRDYLGRK
jgi:outer membrane lipoprotein-sorting protein